MPINQPVPQRKIAPASLAFEDGKRTGSKTAVGTSYQQSLITNININNAPVGDQSDLIRSVYNGTGVADLLSETRSKAHVAGYKHVCQWDISRSHTLEINAWDQLPFDNEVLHTAGAELRNVGGASPDAWEFRAMRGTSGVWWWYAHVRIRLLSTMGCTNAHLGFFIDDVLFRSVALIDAGYAGELPILDCILTAGCHVPIPSGAKFDCRILIDAGVAGFQLFGYPSSIVGYITGHRESLDTDMIHTPDDLTGYVTI